MAVVRTNAQPGLGTAGGIEAEIAHIGAMTIDELRSLWGETFGSDPPPAFSKDLLARAIGYRIQEEAYGGLRPQTVRLLRSLTKAGAEPPRQVKVGSLLVREHRGVLHEVMVAPGGFIWRGQNYESLSTIARKITGVSWNGPRFFGLRSKKDQSFTVDSAGVGTTPAASASPGVGVAVGSSTGRSRRAGRRSSIGTGAHP